MRFTIEEIKRGGRITDFIATSDTSPTFDLRVSAEYREQLQFIVDACNEKEDRVAPIVQEALEATFEQRPGFLTKVSAAIRALSK